MKLVTMPGNGFCFISCVLVTLAEQGINKGLDVLSVEIMIEITNHLAHYKQYGNKKDMTMLLAKCAPTLCCVVTYISACVDTSRTVFWDRSFLH